MADRQDDEACAERLRIALDLAASGIEMRRAQLKRHFPEETSTQIDERLNAWLRERPGAEFGDSPGRVVDLAGVLDR